MQPARTLRSPVDVPNTVVPELYRIVSRAELPARMQGTFTFQEAYMLCVEWNSQHSVREMATVEPAEAP